MERHDADQDSSSASPTTLICLHDKYFYISLDNNFKWLAVSLAFPVSLGF